MSSENLVKMANQIAHYFASEPDRALAVQGVRQHLQNFWTPAMRRQLEAWLQANPGEGLDPLVREAIEVAKAPA
ncbi:formate dehydrogenase subunit delta [Pseudomonas guariconensis]|uniref:formate dehydrogenase subunit delta n=1 Tax=Pseudomonas TaxID=286 RepID=UPI001CE4A107|nr:MULTISPECIES: formate dehydrogenase subunit delta [Pseudomonas]MCO7636212.1 formate dehydrogenase subunit delta [Pseudomonas sp. S 311-6]MCO7516392.1 formate dehydrogenase subunit delta [Pseudomonas putida]MCO7563945.1 formate dehydrogenase subunit delta [Pseudomonas mosselii]MCO7597447.1 formate dehydrogenase subunit delta [Pseudomonas guariconensis]MCO7606708.1 formate dehydrogenase subunit delta [Pseudomonas guariconensis]